MNENEMLINEIIGKLDTILVVVGTVGALVAGAVGFFACDKVVKWIRTPTETIDQKITRRGNEYGRYGAGRSDSAKLGRKPSL